MEDKSKSEIEAAIAAKKRQEQRKKIESEKHWYILLCNPLHERQLLEAFTGIEDPYKRNGKGARRSLPVLNPVIEAYVPVKMEKRKWSDRTKIVPVIQIPGVVFVRFEMERKLDVLRYEDAKGFMFNKEKHEPYRISENQINALRKAVNDCPDMSIQAPLPGDTVKVLAGPFEGYIGEVIKREGKSTFQLRLTDNWAINVSIAEADFVVVPKGTLQELPDTRFV